jgi:hypothetical protein
VHGPAHTPAWQTQSSNAVTTAVPGGAAHSPAFTQSQQSPSPWQQNELSCGGHDDPLELDVLDVVDVVPPVPVVVLVVEVEP